MEQHHPIIFEQVPDFGEELVVSVRPDVLEHADRDDAVEGPAHVAIVLQAKFDPVREARLARAIGRDSELLLGQGDAGDLGAGDAGEIEPETSKPAANVKRGCAVVRQQLGGDVALLCGLRVLERLAGIFEISAGILAVGIEEQTIEALIQVVVDRRCCAWRAAGRCAGAGRETPCAPCSAPCPRTAPPVRRGRAPQAPAGCKDRPW